MVVVMAVAASSSSLLVSSSRHGFGSMRSSDLGGTKYASRVDWSMPPLPSIVTTSRKPSMMMLGCKKKDPELVSDIGLGSSVKDGFFRQKFCIGSYEVGPDRKDLLETLMNCLQETSVNHSKAIGLFHEGMGSTPEMSKRSLLWVATKLHLVVEHYPTRGDHVIQIDNWNATSGRYGVRGNWMIRDWETGKILIRASCIMMMMNKKTRRFSKIPDEVRAEIKHVLVDTPMIVVEDNARKRPKLDEDTVGHVLNGIVPRRSDLDANQHVNTFKYVGWIIESVPMTVKEEYELASMTLEYRRECRKDDVLRCHTCVLGKNNDGIAEDDRVDCQHVLQLEVGGGGGGSGSSGDGDEILKGRTKWRRKYENC